MTNNCSCVITVDPAGEEDTGVVVIVMPDGRCVVTEEIPCAECKAPISAARVDSLIRSGNANLVGLVCQECEVELLDRIAKLGY